MSGNVYLVTMNLLTLIDDGRGLMMQENLFFVPKAISTCRYQYFMCPFFVHTAAGLRTTHGRVPKKQKIPFQICISCPDKWTVRL